MLKRLGRLRPTWTDRRGSAAVEFALVAAPFFALLIAIVATALLFFAQEGLETASEAASRLILTGTAQSAGQSQSQFQASACKALPVYMACSNLYVDVQSYSSFSGLSTSAPTITFDKNGKVSNSFAYSTGTAGSIVVVRLMYIWSVPLGPLGFNLSTLSNGQRLLSAVSVARTESYQ